MCEVVGRGGGMLTVLGAETRPNEERVEAGGGHGDWPMDANGSPVDTGLEK